MDDVTDLVITPFRDIVEKGRTAISNAGDAQPMLKAAQNLVKEGERALKKIEPLSKKQFDEYGPNFLAALRDHEEIAQYRLQLTDALWEFDDYLEAEDFDAEKFAELQALSRATAPKIWDILLKMKLEAPFDSRNFMSQLSPPSSPHPGLTLPLSHRSSNAALSSAGQPRARDSVSSSRTDNKSVGEIHSVETATQQLGNLIDEALNHESAFDPPPDASPLAPPMRSLPPPPAPPPKTELPPPPRPPSANPWDIRSTSLVTDGNHTRIDTSVGRRPPVEPPIYTPVESTPRSPALSMRVPSVAGSIISGSSVRGSGFVQDYTFDHDDRHTSVGSQLSNYSMSPTQTSVRPRVQSGTTPTIPEEGWRAVEKGIEKRSSSRSQSRNRPPATYSTMPRSSRPRQAPSPTSDEVYNQFRESSRSDLLGRSTSQSEMDRRPSFAESLIDPNPLPVMDRDNASSSPQSQPGLEAVPDPPVAPNGEIDSGLIPVDESSFTPPPEDATHYPPRDCSIDNQSSYHIHKGFCEGARDVVSGGIGVKKTKKPGFSSTAIVARCTHCLYELDFRHIELDVNKQDGGNYLKHGIGYRLRFLQKSHLHAKRVDDVLYGCVFCIQAGETLDQSDATVFTSTSALFLHLARHPRPLPRIQGIQVVEEAQVPSEFRNDYDLHLMNPSVPHPVQEKMAYVANLPTGHARESARRLFGQKLLPDRTPALELLQGAKLAAITWPAKYYGEWCFAWHDGVHASMPTEILKLDRPSWSQIKKNGTSRIRARTRWKFSPKDKGEDWLKFDKDEMITNICWANPEFWCWSGTNAKGKWGIFPQAFLDPSTLQEVAMMSGSDRASILSNEKNKSSSILPKFSMRNKHGRPPSIAGSTSSGDTTKSPGGFGGGSFRRSRE